MPIDAASIDARCFAMQHDRVMPAAPMTLGEAVKSVAAGGFTFTSTRHSGVARLPRHTHERHAISLIVEGPRRHAFGSRTFDCVEGAILFVPADREHDSHFARPIARGVMIAMTADAMLDASSPSCFIAPRLLQSDESRRCVAAIAQAVTSSDPLAPLTLESLALEVLTMGRRPAPASTRVPEWLRAAAEHVQRIDSAAPTLSSIAAEVGVHRAHLAREFRRHYGWTIGDAVRAARLERAARLVATSDRPLADIAAECGFADQSHFTRIYHRAFGRSPAAARKRDHREMRLSFKTPRPIDG